MSDEDAEPGPLYKFLVRNNTEVAQLLHERKSYLEDWAYATETDPDLIRAIILHESRGFRNDWERLEAQVSWIRRGSMGSYGYAQLGPVARKESDLTIEKSQTLKGSIQGAARWLQVSVNDLHHVGIKRPTIEQIAAQYNKRSANGEVTEYGREMAWTYRKIKNGEIGKFVNAFAGDGR